MSLDEQLHFWDSRAHELEVTTQKLQARIRHLETENEAPRRLPHCPPQQQGKTTFFFEEPQSQPRSQPTFKVNSLLSVAPKTDHDWLKRRKHLGLSDERSVIQTFFQFLSCTGLPTTSSAKISEKSSSTEDLLQRYQMFTQHPCQKNDRTRQIANFNSVLYISLCRVARYTEKVSVTTVNNYMDDFLPRTTRRGSPIFKKLRTSVVWPVSQAQALRPWLGNRAEEFFLLCKTPVNVPLGLLTNLA